LFEREVDDKTALVATSRVFFTSGYIQDVRVVADIAHKHGAYLLIDDYQGTGQIPIDVNAQDIGLPIWHLLRSYPYPRLVATSLIPSSCSSVGACSSLVLLSNLPACTQEGGSVHDEQ
jgi:cysteine sulfinate desulfinase/cysteine desulfurase-like protein